MNLDMDVYTECHGFGLNKEYEGEKTENNDLVGLLNDEKPDNPLL